MLSIAKVFRDFKDFYSEINAATLTGAIDVIIVEQPDGSFHCSPFHVRFGKLGVLRSREKVVDIEVNGEAVDIQMKLGESGEAFFVEECTEGELEVLPQHFATSPIPTNELSNFEDSINQANEIKCPIPRRNSIDLSKDIAEMESIKFENQTSDYSHRRHTDNTMERRDLSTNIIEFTTKKLRDEYPVEQDQLYDEIKEKVNLMKNMDDDSKIFRPITEQDGLNDSDKSAKSDTKADDNKLNQNLVKDDGKSKKKRRKKSVMKKKNNQRKNSTSSSTGSVNSDPNEPEVTETMTISSATNASTSTDGSPNTDNDVLLVTLPNDESKNVEIKKEPEVKRMRDLDIHFFSDTEVGSGSPRGSRPSTPVQSDTEFEVSQREKKDDVMTSSASWKWGELPTSEDQNDTSTVSESTKRNSMLSGMLSFMKQTNKMRKNIPEGLYLSDLDAEGMDPEVAALYFPQSGVAHQHKEGRREEDRESGNGTSLPQSPTTSMEMIKSMDSDFDDQKVGADSYLNFVSLSLCGGMEKGGPTEDEFESQLVQYSDICMNPTLFSSPNLVVRLNQKYYTWATACPLVMTLLAYQKPLPLEVCDKLVGSANSSMEEVKLEPQHTAENNRRSWFLWRRSGGGSVQEKKSTMKSVESIDKEQSVATQTSPTPLIKDANKDSTEIFNVSVSSEESFALKNQEVADLTDMQQNKNTLTLNTEKFRKTLRLSSDQIEKLNLKNGMNEIEFSVTTAYQGTSRCKCYLFKWKHNDKVVISDIDGTITKSDVLGHILPMVGKDWAQIGVAQLFSKIEENGYKMLYLSARAIGQSRATREYLRSIRQGDVKLPDGPLLLNPTSLISAFHREVIERKPEQFKIECLSDIKSLFDDKNPFYAGYGNRINDVWAYRAVGIPIMRIYTINPRGELKHELTQTFQSTYCSMTFIVDQLFPPIKLTDEDDDIEYTSFNYWRDPVADMEFEIPVAAPGSPGSSTTTTGDSSKDQIKIAATLQVIQSKPLPTIPEN